AGRTADRHGGSPHHPAGRTPAPRRQDRVRGAGGRGAEGEGIMTWLVTLAIRQLALAALAWLFLRALRVRHPASQHAVWTGVAAGILLLAPLTLVTPRWDLALLPASPPPLHAREAAAPAPQTARTPSQSPDPRIAI